MKHAQHKLILFLLLQKTEEHLGLVVAMKTGLALGNMETYGSHHSNQQIPNSIHWVTFQLAEYTEHGLKYTKCYINVSHESKYSSEPINGPMK